MLASRADGAPPLQPVTADPAHQLQIARQFDRDGVPLHAHSLSADPHGFFYAASDTGVYRFDGLHFEPVDNMPSLVVQAGADGWIWAGGNQGLIRFRGQERVVVLRERIVTLMPLGSEMAAAGDTFQLCGITGCKKFPVKPNGGMVAEGAKKLWFGCGQAICSFSADLRIERYEPPVAGDYHWIGAGRDGDGYVWAWDHRTTLRWKPGSEPVLFRWPLHGTEADPMIGLRTREGGIRLPDFYELSHGRIVATSAPTGDAHERPEHREDSFGNLWEVSTTGGLAMFSKRSWVFGWGNAQFPNGCSSLSRLANRILASCATGIFEFEGYTGEAHADWKLLPGTATGVPALASLPLPEGSLWSILATRGVVQLDRAGREIKAAWKGVRPVGLDFRSLFRSRDGRAWVGSKGGLFTLDPRTGALIPEPLPGGYRYATAFATGQDGEEWLGFDGGIARLGSGGWEVVIPREALLNPAVRSIAIAPGGIVWVSYRFPLAFSRLEQVRGRWMRRDFPAEAGFGPSETRSLLADSRGWIWRSTPHGLFVADGVHLQPSDWITLHAFNNLPGDSTGPNAFMEDRDGSVWLATDLGIARIDPDPDWFRPEKLPPAHVTALRWHGRTLLWPASGDRLTDPGGDLEIDFAQWPSLTPRLAGLQFRLAPLETSWRSGENGTVVYPNLQPGKYRFEISARGAAGTPYSFRVEDTSAPWTSAMEIALALSSMGGMFLLWRRARGPVWKSAYWREKEAFLAHRIVSDGPELHSGEVVSGRYRVGERIGQGGFASVWKAVDGRDDSPVAVKFLNAEGEIEDWQIARFEKETAALGRIDHPGIVRLLDSGRSEQGGFWLAMRWVDGPNLRTVLKSGPIPRQVAAGWIRQMGAAMGEAHRCGVLHRDLKPENILIERWEQPDERVVIVDFGAATVEDGLGKASAIHLGSFDYMAPERVQGRSSAASDVYGLAAVAFELLTGVRYAGVAASSLPAMRRLLAGFPERVADLLSEGLSFLPEQRPQDIRVFAEDLAAALAK
jgi:ligand-binding sensor domain-containing protein